ncbi:MAG: PEP-CTERM sorting domain-containing protein [Nitrososphaera sp.]|nr:PEP-CTERM sorting domain-containing protein [Nitrososphaera sp.]
MPTRKKGQIWRNGLRQIDKGTVYVFSCVLSLLICADLAYAAIVTTSFYTDSKEKFVWSFTWDGTPGPISFSPTDAPPPLSPPSTAPSGAWLPGGPAGGATSPVGGFVAGNPLAGDPVRAGSNLALSAQHAIGPHTGIDKDPGDSFTVVIGNADFAGVTGLPFKAIFGAPAPPCPDCSRKHTPHLDQYTLQYQRIAAGAGQPVNFIFSGQHIVPEPGSIVLFGSGALGMMGYGWRRRRKKN